MDKEQATVSSVWPEWTLEKLIGEGSYGRVYKAKKTEGTNEVLSAIKIIKIPQNQSEYTRMIRDGMSEDEVRDYFESFINDITSEIEMMTTLKGSDNIVDYMDHCIVRNKSGTSWTILIRMELLVSLSDYISRHEMDNQDVVWIGIEICRALELCKKHNIIHRDIKPDNIFVSSSGSVKLGDFGIARQLEKTTSGLSKKGTYTYMAPEVYKGEAYGSAVDIYSLGIVMYKLLNNNRLPFSPPPPEKITYQNKEAALTKRMSGEELPPPSNADENVAGVILKACSYEAKGRYSSAAEMESALRKTVKRSITPDVFTPANSPSLSDKFFSLPKGIKVLLVTLPIVVLFFLGVLFSNPLGFIGKSIVPSVTGCILEQANDVLRMERLMGNVDGKVYDNTVKIGYVVTQQPEAGEIVKKKSSVSLTLSAGSLPDCVGLDVDEASTMLEELGFIVERSFEERDDGVADTVISQSLNEGDAAVNNATIVLSICINENSKNVRIPTLVGETYKSAQTALEKCSLNVIVEYQYSDEPKNNVIGQSPDAGVIGCKGDTVTVTVSKGESVKLPSLIGKSCSDALDELNVLGIKANITTSAVSQSAYIDVVLEQSVSAGKSIGKGDTVTLTVGSYTSSADVSQPQTVITTIPASTTTTTSPPLVRTTLPPTTTTTYPKSLQSRTVTVIGTSNGSLMVQSAEDNCVYRLKGASDSYSNGTKLIIKFYYANASVSGSHKGMTLYDVSTEYISEIS